MFLLIILILFHVKGIIACTCGGVVIQLSDQKHCFEIQRDSGNSWVNADTKCSKVGGFLAHISNSSLYSQLKTYVTQNYQKPLMTGATVANIDLDLIALMCPANTFYSLLSADFVSTFFNGTPTDNDRCTFFTNDESGKLYFNSCNSSADVLCDRPMEKVNYCNIMMNCTTTTTSILSSTTTPIVMLSSSIISKAAANTTTISTTKVQSSSPSTVTSSSTIVKSTIPASSSTSIPTTSSTNTTIPSSSSTSTYTATSSSTTPIATLSSTSTIQANSTTPSSSTTNLASNSIPSSVSTSTVKTTSAAVGVTTTTNTQVSVTAATTTTTTAVATTTTASSSKKCGSGYTRIFGWCVPWWCWLIFGLLLLGLLLCFLSWCCHFCNAACLCSHQQMAENGIVKPLDAVACQTDPMPMPRTETVYVPIPQTPPPEKEKIIVKEIEKSPQIHTYIHTREIIHENHTSSHQPSMVYDVKVYENNYNQNTLVIPPAIQQPVSLPAVFLPPPSMNFDNDFLSTDSIPFINEDKMPQDVTDPIIPVPLPLPESKKKRRPITPLKQNRPPIGGLHPKMPDNATKIDEPSPREFPEQPTSVGSNREFPEPPPESPPVKQSVSPPLVNNFVQPNTPPEDHNGPQKQTHPSKHRGQSPRTNQNSDEPPSENPSSNLDEPQNHPKARSPPVAPPTRRVSPMNDSPTKLPSSPRKFNCPPPQISNQSLTTPKQPNNTRRRSPIPEEPGNFDKNSPNDVSMKAPHGRLGGAIHGRPENWKPWSNNSQPFSSHPGFLSNDD